jgi:hypothetical protein
VSTRAAGTPRHLVGVLGGARVASVDALGAVRPERALWSLEWWIGADDRWHLPARETAVRQRLVDHAPVVTTSMRVPGGDAVHTVSGATGGAVVVDIENASPAPFVAVLAVRGATVVALEDTTVLVDGVPAITAVRPPSRWALATDGSLADIVTSGNAREGPMPVRRDRRATVDAALLYPVAHRTRLRVAVALGRHDTDRVTELDLTALPDAHAVARGWRAQLERGMNVGLPDAQLQALIDEARAQLLLAGQAWRPSPAVYAALEDWGFDDEALEVWQRLGMLDRRRAVRSRGARGVGWSWLLQAADAPEEALLAARDLLVRDRGDRIDLLSEWPTDWRGQPVDVRDAPVAHGKVSFAVRWHGERPALLWDVPAGVELRAPGLDPEWSTRQSRGETLFGTSE